MARTATTRKRRRGWALTITAALLAVVWVGGMKMWVRMWPHAKFGVELSFGQVAVYRTDTPIYAGAPLCDVLVVNNWEVRWLPSYLEFPSTQSVVLFVPLWPFVLLTGVPGVWMLVKTRKRTNPNACPACGYDRTGLPQTSTGPAPCPECGKGECNDAVCGSAPDTVKR